MARSRKITLAKVRELALTLPGVEVKRGMLVDLLENAWRRRAPKQPLAELEEGC